MLRLPRGVCGIGSMFSLQRFGMFPQRRAQGEEQASHRSATPPKQRNGKQKATKHKKQIVDKDARRQGGTITSHVDRRRYTEPDSIWMALKTGSVRLLKLTWVVSLSKANGILGRRQDLPEEAFISIKELQQLWLASGRRDGPNTGNSDGILPIIAISFCWLTSAHPDPEGKQLKTIAAVLEAELVKYRTESSKSFKGFADMGIFWDWASIYQKDPALFDVSETPAAKAEGDERAAFIADLQARRKFYGGAKYEASRTGEEKQAFSYALGETMDLWYAHQGTIVYKLTKLPDGNTSRQKGYYDSGWPTYERCCAEQIKRVSFRFAREFKMVLDLGSEDPEEIGRAWPTAPEDFDELLESKTFTNGSDKEIVKSQYRRFTVSQLGGAEQLDFDGMPHPSVAEAARFGRCLNLCVNVSELSLSRAGLDDTSCMAIFSNLSEGALPRLTRLRLIQNLIGDAGVDALAVACTLALPSLQEIYVQGNNISPQALERLKARVTEQGRDLMISLSYH